MPSMQFSSVDSVMRVSGLGVKEVGFDSVVVRTMFIVARRGEYAHLYVSFCMIEEIRFGAVEVDFQAAVDHP